MMFKQILKSITRKEWVFVGLISGLLMVITTFPIIWAYYHVPAQTQYNGMNLVGEADYSVYFSYINQVKAGRFLLLDYFTGEPQSGGIFNIFWLGVGIMASIFSLTPWVAFHLSRLIMIPIFCLIFYIFSAYIFPAPKLRQWSLAFAGFSSGLGAYLALIINGNWERAFNWLGAALPIDLWVTESNIFFSIYENPHFVLSLALMTLFFLMLLLAWENNNYKYSLVAGLTGLVWFNFHPYYAPYVLAIGFIFATYLVARYKKWDAFTHLLISCLIAFISVAYHFIIIEGDYIIGTRSSQNVTITPALIYVAAGYGLLLLFSLPSVYFLAKKHRAIPDKFVFLLICLVVGLNLLYAPVSINRRFTEGLQIPMIFLTVYVLTILAYYVKLNWARLGKILTNKFVLIFLFIIFFCSTTLFILARDLYFISRQHSNFYFSDQYLEAVDFLKGENQTKVVLTHTYNGHFLPSLINMPVFSGHGHETLDFIAKQQMLEDFYANKYEQAQAEKFLNDNNIGYILYTGWEKSDTKINLNEQPYLEQIFSNSQTAIYKIIKQ